MGKTIADSFGNFYAGKTVVVTGHTGFKGSWLSVWLDQLGAKVIGYSLNPPTEPSHYTACQMKNRIIDLRADVLNFENLSSAFKEYRPDIIFHLAAQPIVRRSFKEPLNTYNVNIMGTVNVIEAARQMSPTASLVVVTSDKVYHNAEWEWGYRETDPVGGNDPYASSKACVELIVATYQNPHFQKSVEPQCDLSIATARAGNVIGGGDWAQDRLIPDTVRAIVKGQDVVIRNPDATRPWQHVLEALSGYLWLGAVMLQNRDLYCSAWNFGPRYEFMIPVSEIVNRILSTWPATQTKLVIQSNQRIKESKALHIDINKAGYHLKWKPVWQIEQTLDLVIGWYKEFYSSNRPDMHQVSQEQIRLYTDGARQRGLAWT